MASKRHGLLVNASEEQILRILEHGCGYRVCPKVRMTDVIDDQDYPWSDVHRDFMRKAHFDFVLTEPTGGLRPVAAIELDGPYHSDHVQKRRDDLENEICRSAKLPLFRFTHPGIDESVRPEWVGHVLECWKWDLKNSGRQTDQDERFPLCWFLAACKSCYLRNKAGAALTIEVLEQDCLCCPVEGCTNAEGTARVRVVASGHEAFGEGTISTSTFSLSRKMLVWLALDLAEYDALKQLAIFHAPCGVAPPYVGPSPVSTRPDQ
jgi:hypothetical protein